MTNDRRRHANTPQRSHRGVDRVGAVAAVHKKDIVWAFKWKGPLGDLWDAEAASRLRVRVGAVMKLYLQKLRDGAFKTGPFWTISSLIFSVVGRMGRGGCSSPQGLQKPGPLPQ